MHTRSRLTAALLLSITLPAIPAVAEHQGIETVIVTAKRNPEDPPIVADARTRLSRTPGAVAVVSAESYEKRLAIGFSDMLRNVPGVLAQKRYGEESRLSIRGSGLNQSFHQRGVLLAEDGVPFADADGFSDFQKVDAMSARYIEVYKGSNALRFGGAQLGGAVNLVTMTGKTADAQNLLRLEGGSFDTLRGRAAVARQFGNWDAYVAISGLTTSGYRQNSGQDQFRGVLNIGYSFDEEQEIRLIVHGADIKQEVPGTLTLAQALATPEVAGAGVLANRWHRDQAIMRTSLQTHWRFDDNLVFEGGVYGTWMDLHHPISLVIDQRPMQGGAFGRFDWTGDIGGHKADLFWGVSYRQGVLRQKLFNNVGGVSGFQFGNSKQEASGMDLFAEGRFFLLDKLALVAGGSYGRATRDYSDYVNPANNASKDFDWFSPRFGVLWQDDNDVQFYANVTRSVEPPHFGALVQSPFPQFVPVQSQRAWTGEVGSRGTIEDWTWDVTLFRSHIKGELLAFTPGPGIPAAVFNADKTIHQGLEVALSWHLTDDLLHGALLLNQTYTWSDFYFDNDPVYGNNMLPVMPEHMYRAELKYEHPAGFYVTPSVEWRPEDVWVDYANTLKAPGYAIFNIAAGYNISETLSLFVDARNLGDKTYLPEFGAITNATIPAINTAVFYPGEGRSVFVGTTWKF